MNKGRNYKLKYVPLFLTYFIINIALFLASSFLPVRYSLFISAGIQGIYTIVIMIYKPY
jgi:hypothetical protein